MSQLSEAMEEALSMVPDDWARPIRRFQFRGRTVDFPLFQQTFDALKNRGLIEWRGGPGAWEWRKKP